jgi:NAD(P)-dependent dehydrogenase (short-subunit alcohol dehydrogenase family)
MIITNQTVVITGASTGIGRSCALHLDKLGFRVFAGVRKDVDGQTLRRHASGLLQPIIIDVTNEATINMAVKMVTDSVGEMGLTGLVNNAGIVVAGPLEFLPLAEIRQQFEINVLGQIAVTQAFLPLIRQGGNGRIINMGSMSGRIAMPFMGPYAASKFALEALTDSLRLELHPWGIKVIIIEPGAVKTPIWEKTIRIGHQIIDKLPPQAHQFYGLILKRLPEAARKSNQAGVSPEKVALAVTHALTVPQPKIRYQVGRDAIMVSWFARLVPDLLRDWLIKKSM